jgi:hypothetical protein
MPRVTLRANGVVTPSYLVKLPETYAGLLKLADIKLGEGFGAKRIFTQNAAEIHEEEFELIEDNDVLYVTRGEDWIQPPAPPATATSSDAAGAAPAATAPLPWPPAKPPAQASKEMPPGWEAVRHEPPSGAYTVYEGPAGEKVRSINDPAIQAAYVAGIQAATQAQQQQAAVMMQYDGQAHPPFHMSPVSQGSHIMAAPHGDSPFGAPAHTTHPAFGDSSQPYAAMAGQYGVDGMGDSAVYQHYAAMNAHFQQQQQQSPPPGYSGYAQQSAYNPSAVAAAARAAAAAAAVAAAAAAHAAAQAPQAPGAASLAPDTPSTAGPAGHAHASSQLLIAPRGFAQLKSAHLEDCPMEDVDPTSVQVPLVAAMSMDTSTCTAPSTNVEAIPWSAVRFPSAAPGPGINPQVTIVTESVVAQVCALPALQPPHALPTAVQAQPATNGSIPRDSQHNWQQQQQQNKTTFVCRYFGCARPFATSDAARWHARKNHPEWLKLIPRGIDGYCWRIENTYVRCIHENLPPPAKKPREDEKEEAKGLPRGGSAPSGSAPSGSAPSGSAPSGSAPSGGTPSGGTPSAERSSTTAAATTPAATAVSPHGLTTAPKSKQPINPADFYVMPTKDDSPTTTEGGAEAGASGSAAAAGGSGAMADDDEGGGGGGGGPTSPSKAQRQHLAAGSVARLAKSPLVQLASLLLADRQVALMVSDCMLITSLISAARIAPTRRSAGSSDGL